MCLINWSCLEKREKNRESQGEQNSTWPGVLHSTGGGIGVQSEMEKKQKIRGKNAFFLLIVLGNFAQSRS